MSALPDIEARYRDCLTYNFGMRNADKLAHEDVPYILAELRKAREALASIHALTLDPEHYDSRGPSNGYVSVDDIRAAVAAANGDGK